MLSGLDDCILLCHMNLRMTTLSNQIGLNLLWLYLPHVMSDDGTNVENYDKSNFLTVYSIP